MKRGSRSKPGNLASFLAILCAWLWTTASWSDDFDPSKVVFCNGVRYYGECPTPQSIVPGPNPYDLPAFVDGITALRSGDYEAAIKLLRDAAQALPDDVQIANALNEARRRLADQFSDQANRLYESGEFAAATTKFNEAANALPDRAEFFRQQADIAQRAADEGAAQQRRKAELQERVDKLRVKNLGDRAARLRKETLLIAAAKAAEDRRADEQKTAAERDRASAILGGIRRIQVPPPVSPHVAKIGFKIPRDEHAGAVLFGTEVGLVGLTVFGQIAGYPLWSAKILLISGKTLFANLDGAEVYLAREDARYDAALSYLKNPATRDLFMRTTQCLREHRQMPEQATSDMVLAARTMVSSGNGRSSASVAWDAMMSPEAKGAALTRLMIDVGAEGVGFLSGLYVAHEMAGRDAAFNEAVDFLSEAKSAAKQTSDPVTLSYLKEASDRANEVIAKAYHAVHPAEVGVEGIEHLYAEWQADRALEGHDDDTPDDSMH